MCALNNKALGILKSGPPGTCDPIPDLPDWPNLLKSANCASNPACTAAVKHDRPNVLQPVQLMHSSACAFRFKDGVTREALVAFDNALTDNVLKGKLAEETRMLKAQLATADARASAHLQELTPLKMAKAVTTTTVYPMAGFEGGGSPGWTPPVNRPVVDVAKSSAMAFATATALSVSVPAGQTFLAHPTAAVPSGAGHRPTDVEWEVVGPAMAQRLPAGWPAGKGIGSVQVTTTDTITVFSECDYKGTSKTLNIGTHSLQDMTGMLKVKSILVSPGLVATVFSTVAAAGTAGGAGKVVAFDASKACLVEIEQVGKIVVQMATNPPPPAEEATPCFRTEDFDARAGHAYTMKGVTQFECDSICADLPWCKGYSRKMGVPPGARDVCGFKNTVNLNRVAGDTTWQTRVKSMSPWTILDKKDVPGSLGNLNNMTVDECDRLCEQTPACVGYARQRLPAGVDRGTCVLKPDVQNAIQTNSDGWNLRVRGQPVCTPTPLPPDQVKKVDGCEFQIMDMSCPDGKKMTGGIVRYGRWDGGQGRCDKAGIPPNVPFPVIQGHFPLPAGMTSIQNVNGIVGGDPIRNVSKQFDVMYTCGGV